MKSAWYAYGLLCGGAMLASPLRAAGMATDAELLEYLGSVDSNEAGWHDYLASTEVDKLVKPAATTPDAAPPAQPPPAAQPVVPASAPPALKVPRKVKQS